MLKGSVDPSWRDLKCIQEIILWAWYLYPVDLKSIPWPDYLKINLPAMDVGLSSELPSLRPISPSGWQNTLHSHHEFYHEVVCFFHFFIHLRRYDSTPRQGRSLSDITSPIVNIYSHYNNIPLSTSPPRVVMIMCVCYRPVVEQLVCLLVWWWCVCCLFLCTGHELSNGH